MTKTTYPIVFASDENGSTLLGVALFSLLQTAGPETSYMVYVLDTGLSENSKQKIESLKQQFDFGLEIIDALPIIKQYIKNPTIVQRWPLAAYARLFAHRLLPEKEKVIAYMDIDTLVCKDLGELFATDMTGKPLAAVFYHPQGFNSGVLLMNLEYLREIEYENMLSICQDERKTNYQGEEDYLDDQHILNYFFAEKTVHLAPKWNWKSNYEPRMIRGVKAQEKHFKPFDYKEGLEACLDPGILHFMDLQKPPRRPHTFNGDRYRKVWLQSPWKDDPAIKLGWAAKFRYAVNYLQSIGIRRKTRKMYDKVSGLIGK